jgi:hypothetical protein
MLTFDRCRNRKNNRESGPNRGRTVHEPHVNLAATMKSNRDACVFHSADLSALGPLDPKLDMIDIDEVKLLL